MFGSKNKKVSGYLTIMSEGPLVEADTLQCVHCGKHWIVRPGSGIERSFCKRCMGVLCGSPECEPCVPFEARLEIVEGGTLTANRYMEDFLKIKKGKIEL